MLEAPRRVWRIPVLYGGEAGPDLSDVAAATGLSEDEVVALHAGTLFRVYVQGFLPGFAYLGDLPVGFDLPRLTIPRARAGRLGRHRPAHGRHLPRGIPRRLAADRPHAAALFDLHRRRPPCSRRAMACASWPLRPPSTRRSGRP